MKFVAYSLAVLSFVWVAQAATVLNMLNAISACPSSGSCKDAVANTKCQSVKGCTTGACVCDDGYWRDGTSGSYSCKAYKKSGEACAAADRCETDYICDTTCKKRPVQGEACSATLPCKNGENLYCDTTCKKMTELAKGATCPATNSYCKEGTTCYSGKCEEYLDNGATCTNPYTAGNGVCMSYSSYGCNTHSGSTTCSCNTAGYTVKEANMGNVCLAAAATLVDNGGACDASPTASSGKWCKGLKQTCAVCPEGGADKCVEGAGSITMRNSLLIGVLAALAIIIKL